MPDISEMPVIEGRLFSSGDKENDVASLTGRAGVSCAMEQLTIPRSGSVPRRAGGMGRGHDGVVCVDNGVVSEAT